MLNQTSKMAEGGGSEEQESDGWPFDFIGDVDDDLKCIICLLPMNNPHQISKCGHCMCFSCLDAVITR